MMPPKYSRVTTKTKVPIGIFMPVPRKKKEKEMVFDLSNKGTAAGWAET